MPIYSGFKLESLLGVLESPVGVGFIEFGFDLGNVM